MARRGSGIDRPRSLRSVFMRAGGEFRGVGRHGHPSHLTHAARCGLGEDRSFIRSIRSSLMNMEAAPPCADGARCLNNHLAAFSAAIFSPINQSALLSLMS